MEHLVYAAVIAILAILALIVWVRERLEKKQALRERDEIEVEERRMFDFLHGLGEKLQDDNSPGNMHRYIVDGVAEVIGADAGILYLLDGGTNQLVPVCQTESVAPVIPAPKEILRIEDDDEANSQYRGFVRLSALEIEGSLIGSALLSESSVFVEDLGKHPQFESCGDRFHEELSFVAAPLIYGQKKVGVLAMVRNDSGFSLNDREVFDSVSEQSSFALGSAIIHSEAAEKRRLERELQQASEIQRVLLPRSSPDLSDYAVAAEYHAARIVSGDYYDYLRVDEDNFGIAIGDVCGKGIAASLIMAMCRSNLRGNAPENLSPASVLHSVNRSIFPDIRQDMFVSLLYLILERGSSEITLARAGHEPPVLFHRATGKTELVETPGLAAGIDKGPVFKRSVKDHRVRMEPGDILLLYTDGVTESLDRDGDEYGIERLCDFVELSSDCEVDELVAAIQEDVGAFSEGIAQTDDITLIAIQKR
ncbi:MAG: GAF domain-containing SpoIIE family protein phosphatase [Verrucomicrobiota bacterium]